MFIGLFWWQLQYGYGPSQIYFEKDYLAMVIQDCYYFNEVGVYYFQFSLFI